MATTEGGAAAAHHHHHHQSTIATQQHEQQPPPYLPVITASTMRHILSYPTLIQALRAAFADSHLYSTPPRHHHSIPTPSSTPATLLLMPAWSRASFIGVKIAAVFPHNNHLGLPAVSASYLLLSAHTGTPLCLLDGKELTVWRTACASALAASFLAKEKAQVLLMVGTGSMAPHLIKAHLSVRPSIRSVWIWNRSSNKVAGLARQLTEDQGFEGVSFRECSDLEVGAREADVISCATLSEEVLVQGSWLKPGVHLDLVGSFTPAMRECDDEAVRMGRVFVDSNLALSEAGELVGALERGVISVSDVVGDLSELAKGEKQGRQTDQEITLFKSVGCAIEDLAAAALIYTKLHG